MASAADDGQFKEVCPGQERSGHKHDLPERGRRQDVCTEDDIDAVHRAIGDHPFRAGEQLFCWLETESDRPGDARAELR